MAKSIPLPKAYKSLGQSARSYDAFSEKGENPNKEEVYALLNFLAESNLPKVKSKSKSKVRESLVEDLISVGLAYTPGQDISSTVDNLALKMQPRVVKGGQNLIKRMYQNLRDLFSGRRKKTTLTVLGGMLAGAAAGAVIGAVAIPLIGGAVGALAGGALALVGGTVGFSILTGSVGGWLGNRIAKKAFKSERRFELTTKVTKRIKKQFALPSSIALMMNAYLVNRQKAVASPLCQHLYKNMRRLGLKHTDPAGLEAIARFFVQERALLQREIKKDSNNEQLKIDRDALDTFLEYLEFSPGVSMGTRDLITKTKEKYSGTEVTVAESVPEQAPAPEQANANKVAVKEERKAANAVYYRYYVERESQVNLPQLILCEKNNASAQVEREVHIDLDSIKDSNEVSLSVLVSELEAMYKNSSNKEIKIRAQGNDNLAIHLYAAALKAQLKPTLDEIEYPNTSLQERAKRESLLTNAARLATTKLPDVDVTVAHRATLDKRK